MTTSGGVASAFGFRYQYLVTVQILLELYEGSDLLDWVVDVDRAEQDSADIMVYSSASVPPERVIQVKASLAASSTTIGVTRVRQLLTALRIEHPAAATWELVTNRAMTADLKRKLAAKELAFLAPQEKFHRRNETLNELTDSLLQQIGRLRSTGAGGLGVDLQYLLLRQLVDMVHEAGSRPVEQRITRGAVRGVMEGATPVLSDALGVRGWGVCIQVPTGNYIERPTVTEFLRQNLPLSALFGGSPPVAVIHGMSGTGKTAAASIFACSRVEHLAFVLWLDASSPSTLEAQLPVVLDRMGAQAPAADLSSQVLMSLLGELPVPWLLVLDGAQSLDSIDAWVPRSGYGQTLITTTRADWPANFAPAWPLSGFSDTEARGFFAKRFNRAESSWTPDELRACEKIAEALAFWPLALEVAAGWIRGRGGSLEIMRHFAERIERLNLDDVSFLPHGYPRTAAQVIIDLWTELSPPAQRVLPALLFFGGAGVPERLIIDWAERLDLRGGDVLEELRRASIVRRQITPSGTPHDFDESVVIHDFVELVVRTRDIGLDGAAVFALVETCEQALAHLLEGGSFREGAVLVRPVDQFLRKLIVSIQDEPSVLIRCSVLMHNLAQVAVLTANVTLARTWFLAAYNVRRADADFVRETAGVQMQLQTLAGAAIVMVRQNDVESLKSVAECADELMKGTDVSAFDAQTLAAIGSIRGNVAIRLPESLDHTPALNQTLPGGSAWRDASKGSLKVNRLQNEMERALRLVETDRWEQGVGAALTAANRGLEENLLVDWMVDSLLDVGLVLVTAISRRQHDLPDGLLSGLRRMTAWFRENPVPFDELQQQRLSLLQALATGEPSAIRTAVRMLPGPEELTLVVSTWSQLASGVASQLDRFRRYELFARWSDGVTVEVGVDGGEDINFWQEIEPSDGTAMLWVCTSSRVRYDSRGKSDPVREMFITSGLQPDQEGKIQPAHGWLATLEGDALTINDGEGLSLVIVDGLDSVFCERIHAWHGLVLIYADRALVKPKDRPPSGWVPLAMNPKKLTRSISGPFVRWFERLLALWKRVTGTGAL